MTPPRIGLVVTGGTITSRGVDRLDPFYGDSGLTIAARQLLERLPELGALAEMVPVPFPASRSSHELTIGDWLALRRTLVDALSRERLDGIVVTHGTNTLEETSYFLSLTIRDERPIVLTAAMRPVSAISSDADLNLLHAVHTAAAPASRGRGVLVVVDQAIHAARDVTKLSTFRLDAFASPDTGPLGHVHAAGDVVYRRDVAAPAGDPIDVSRLETLPRVDIVVSYLAADGSHVDASVAAGAAGIVHGGTGAGRATPAEADALTRAAARGVVVCRGTRIPAGRVIRDPSFAAPGFVAVGDLNVWKARVLLSLLLTTTSDPREIQQAFDTR